MSKSKENKAPRDADEAKQQRRRAQINRAAAVYFDVCRKLAGAVNRLRHRNDKSS